MGNPKHAKIEKYNPKKIHLRDLRPKNLHPKAKFRIFMSIIGTLLLIFGCLYMLSTSTFYLDVDTSTSIGISYFFKNAVFIAYPIGTLIIILILWYVMIKDCPISENAKINYNITHDKGKQGVKLAAAVAAAIANKGSGQSINTLADAAWDYYETSDQKEAQHGVSIDQGSGRSNK